MFKLMVYNYLFFSLFKIFLVFDLTNWDKIVYFLHLVPGIPVEPSTKLPNTLIKISSSVLNNNNPK